jgi:ribonuclease M5
MIRSFIGGSVPQDTVKHAYIPDIFGKEKRKTGYSKEGKLGVEGVPTKVIMSALEKAGVTCEETGDGEERRLITNVDLYEDGFSGTKQSREKRLRLLEYFELPSRLSSGSLVSVLNTFITYDEYKAAAEEINRKFGDDTKCTE